MTTLRWGDDVPSGTADARARLVDAAAVCIDRFGIAKTTLDDVAAEAHVSRATVYRYIPNRDVLVLDVMLRELERSYERSLHDFVDQLATTDDAAIAIVDAAAYLLATVRANPKLQLFLGSDDGGGASTVRGASAAFFAAVADDLRPYLTAARNAGVLRADAPLDDLAEWILRTIVSLLTVPGTRQRTPDEERDLLRTFLVPALLPPG